MTTDVRQLFVIGAGVILRAISDERVAAGWDRPSVLEDQTIGSLAGHVARGGVWIVEEYLDAPLEKDTADFVSAGDYFAQLKSIMASPDGGKAIRDRGAAIASSGHAAVVAELSERAPRVIARIAEQPEGRLIAAINGTVLDFDDYLVTRIVEQTVHLDDLARSIGHDDGWRLPDDTYDLVNSVATETGRRHLGPQTVLRGLYRHGFADAAFPVF